jgi:hypothetical protein
MLDWKLFKAILAGGKPSIPNLALSSSEELSDEGLTMGTLFIGRQGTGKTSCLARHILDYIKKYSDRAVFVLDWSGSLTDTLFKLILQDPLAGRLVKKIVYDELGHPDWVIPLPEFSPHYGPLEDGFGGERKMFEEQLQRVSTNLTKLAPELIRDAPFLAGLGLREIAPHVMRLLTAMTNDYGESWQITEVKKLLVDEQLMRKALQMYGHKVPESKWFLEKVFIHLRPAERELRSYALLALLGAIEPREIRARVGYFRPGWTPGEAIAKGLLVVVNGARLINQKNAQHYLFTQAYSLIMAEINRRHPGNEQDKPVELIMDEVYSLLSIPGMAEEVGMISPLYRSRKLELCVVLQSLSQLAPTLKQQIWSIGNITSFALSNFDEAYEIAQQLFKYEPLIVKLPAENENQRPITETDRGQYLEIANWIQRLKHRECIVRSYRSEKLLDKFIRYIPKTRDNNITQTDQSVDELKEDLLKERGVRVRDALDVINRRQMASEERVTQTTPPTL